MSFLERQDRRIVAGSKLLGGLVPKIKFNADLVIDITLMIVLSPIWIPWALITWPIGFIAEKLDERQHSIKTVKL